MRCVLVLLAGFFISVPTHAEVEMSPLVISTPPLQITHIGQSRDGIFVTDEQILFVRKGSTFNSHTQIYLKNLNTGSENQISHQLGQLQLSSLLRDDHGILFTSSTDEDQEIPVAILHGQRSPSSIDPGLFTYFNFSPQDIYLSQLDGSAIQRLTSSPGFDGLPSLKKDSNLVYFTRWEKKKFRLYSLALNKPNEAHLLLNSPGHNLDTHFSPNGQKVAWSHFSKDFKTAQIKIAQHNFKNIKDLTPSDEGHNWGARFHPNGKTLLFSSKVGPMNNYDLFEMTLDGKCQRQLSTFEGDEYLPQISPNGQKIMFTSTLAGQEQLFMMDYPSTPLECP